jgi:hypothetical protein
VRAEFHRPDQPEQVVARAWLDAGGAVRVDAPADAPGAVREAVRRIFRPVPAAVDDPALRSLGTRGPSVLEPGDLRWFVAAARTRSQAEGLSVRFVPGGEQGMGWDPAGAYRTFTESVERRERMASARFAGAVQAHG